MFYVYLITCLINSFKYVGKAKDYKKRWKYHAKESSLKNPPFYLHRAIKKHGIENFKFEILEEFKTEREALEREIYWIKELNTLAPNGYNLTKGGEGVSGLKHSKKTKRTWSKKRKGRKTSKIIKKRISVGLVNYYKNPESKIKTSIATKKYYSSLTPEQRKKPKEFCKILSIAQRKRFKNPKARKKVSVGLKNSLKVAAARKKRYENPIEKLRLAIPVISINLNTKEESYWYGIRECARQLNLQHIMEIIKGIRKQTKGYTFRLATSDEIRFYTKEKKVA